MGNSCTVPFTLEEQVILQPFLTKTVVCLISGPSAVGKGEIIRSLVHVYVQLVRYTTRPKWREDKEGYQYHFVDHATFDNMILTKSFLEWRSYGSSYYGTSREDFIKTFLLGGIMIVDVNPHMAIELKNLCQIAGIHCIDFFITPGRTELLESESGIELAISILNNRFKKRNRGEEEKEITARLNLAKTFLHDASKFTYRIGSIDGKQAVATSEVITVAEKALYQLQCHNS